MMKTRQYPLVILTTLLVLMWVPVLVHQMLHFDGFRAGLVRQPFSDTLGHVLAYALPALELLAVVLLVAGRPKNLIISPYFLSTILLTAFTVYIITALTGLWGKLPCGCGSVIKGMTWQQHLWFNLFFLGISSFGLILSMRSIGLSRRAGGGNGQSISHSLQRKCEPLHILYIRFVFMVCFHLWFPLRYTVFPGRPVRK